MRIGRSVKLASNVSLLRAAMALLRVTPSDLIRTTLKGLLGTFAIRPSIETVTLGKSGLVGMQ